VLPLVAVSVAKAQDYVTAVGYHFDRLLAVLLRRFVWLGLRVRWL